MWLLLIPLALAAYMLPRPIFSPSPKVSPTLAISAKQEQRTAESSKDEGLRTTNISAMYNASNTIDAELFPEDAPGEDRIIEQLLFTMPKNKTVRIKKIILPNGFHEWDASSGRKYFVKNRCNVDRCSLTADPADLATADAVLIKSNYQRLRVKRSPNQIWILYNLESPYHSVHLPLPEIFNWTATYRRDSDIVTPYARWVYYNSFITERELNRNYAADKTKQVAWFVSNCHTPNSRLEYARELSQFISVDIYGNCGTHHCPRYDPKCSQMLNRDYKFYLSFENSNCRDYITEKFFENGLGHDVVPVVMGARPEDYAAVAPPHSYIHVEEFENAEELAGYLLALDEDDALYNSYFTWKGTGEFINTFFFCRLCAMVHANDQRLRSAYYKNVQAWWHKGKGTCTRGEWRNLHHLD